MKKYALIFTILMFLLLVSCNKQTAQSESCVSSSTDDKEISAIEKTSLVNSIDKLTDVNGVISVTNQSFSTPIDGVVAYKVLYETENGKLSADVVLPDDYADKSYTVLIYFPEVHTYIETLATNYALNGIIVIRPYARGYDESDGVRDLGGQKDITDAQKLLNIFDSASFIKNSKIFVAGSSEGSITALRMMAEDGDKRISGCAVIDAITDLPAFCSFRGEGVINLVTALIGKTYEEAPEEYKLRSAIEFTEKLDRPILILHYTQTPHFLIEQTDAFYDAIKDVNRDCTYHKIDALSSDFGGNNQESLDLLLSWLNKYD